jgi:hypothetical protein
MKMAEQNCAHDECDCLVQDGKGVDKEVNFFAATFAQWLAQRAAAKNVNAAIRIAHKFAHRWLKLGPAVNTFCYDSS